VCSALALMTRRDDPDDPDERRDPDNDPDDGDLGGRACSVCRQPWYTHFHVTEAQSAELVRKDMTGE